jgi:hypothetical protein
MNKNKTKNNVRKIQINDFEKFPLENLLSIADLKVISNCLIEQGIPINWITGILIIDKINQMLNQKESVTLN